MHETRSTLRRHIMFYLDVFDGDHETRIGWLGDISETGLMIISQKELVLEKPLIITIVLPKNEPFNSRRMKAEVELRWSSPDKNPAYRIYGGVFTRTPAGSEKVIRALIRLYGFSDDQNLTKFSQRANDYIDITYEEEAREE